MKYYLNKRQQNSINGEHELHKETCECLPSLENRECIGDFDNDISAFGQAAYNHPNWIIDGCRFCCRGIHRM